MRRFLLLTAFLAGSFLAPAKAESNVSTIEAKSSRVSAVTLYRNQALVTRIVEIDGPVGIHELVVPNLPDQIASDSIYTESTAGVTVRAVQPRSRAVDQSPKEEVRKFENRLKELQRSIDAGTMRIASLAKRLEYLDKLEIFVAPTATTELTHGVLNAESLEKITEFSFKQRDSIAQEQLKAQSELRDLQAEQELANRQLAEMTANSTKTVYEAVVYLTKETDGPAQVRLNYLVNQCGWSPTYAIHAAEASEKVGLEYNALIFQFSGEDWTGVDLTLSTASPELSATRPGLAPFRVSLVTGAAPQAPAAQTEIVRQAFGQQQSAYLSNRNAIGFEGNSATSWSINGAVSSVQCIELVGDRNALNEIRAQLTDQTQQPSLSYSLATAVTLTNRREQQMIRILESELPSISYFVATPVLTNFVFRESEVTNSSGSDLLAGPLTVYLNDRFVGRGEIPTVTRGERFVVGFGADPQLRTQRELVSKGDSVQGGNREIKLEYRLLVENYKEQPVQVRLMDRLPQTGNDNEVRVSLVSSELKLSDDSQYERLEKGKGILRWDINVPASSSGAKSWQTKYSFSVDFDRNFTLVDASQSGEAQVDFNNLQRLRSKR